MNLQRFDLDTCCKKVADTFIRISSLLVDETELNKVFVSLLLNFIDNLKEDDISDGFILKVYSLVAQEKEESLSEMFAFGLACFLKLLLIDEESIPRNSVNEALISNMDYMSEKIDARLKRRKPSITSFVLVEKYKESIPNVLEKLKDDIAG